MKTIRIPYYSVDRAEARQQFKDAGVENQTAIEIDLRGTTFFGIGVRTAVYRITKTRFHHTSMYDPNVHGKKQGFWQRVFAKFHKTNS